MKLFNLLLHLFKLTLLLPLLKIRNNGRHTREYLQNKFAHIVTLFGLADRLRGLYPTKDANQ